MEGKFNLLSRTVHHVQRYRHILFVLLKYGFEDVVANLRLEGSERRFFFFRHRRKQIANISRPERMRLALEELGPTFVKMGQTLSTRSDLLGEDYRIELAKLQDKVSPFPVSRVHTIIRSELKQDVQQLFEVFDEEPLAAGSLGQVHRATLHNGDMVAVKIQRPEVRRQIGIDLEIIHYFATLMERHLELGQLHKPTHIADEFARTIRQELDYRIEASNIVRFAQLYEADPDVYIHKVYRDISTQKVIVTEFIKGVKPSDHKGMAMLAIDPEIVANKGADLIISQVFLHGFFHADPHPGNIMVLPGNIISFLDFGMVGRMDRQSRELFADLLVHVLAENENKATDALLKLTHGHSLVDRLALERDIKELMDQYLSLPLKELQVGNLTQRLMDLTVRHELGLPAHYFLLIKAISQIEDVGCSLAPDFDFTERAGPYIRKIMMNRYHPKRVFRDLYETSTDLVYLFKDMPGEMRELLKQARQGKFKIELDHLRITPIIQTLERVSNRISSAIVLAAMIVGSSLIVHAKIPPVWYNIPVIGLGGFLISGLMGISLLRSIWKRRDD